MKLGIFKHVRGIDAAIKIVGVKSYPDGYSVIVYWLNVCNPKNVYMIDGKPRVEFITYKEVDNWKELNV